MRADAPLAAALLLIAALLAAPCTADSSLRAVQLPEPAADWAIDPASGRLFAAYPGSGRVAEVSWDTGRTVREWAVGQGLSRLLRKLDWLVAVSRDRSQGDRLTVISLGAGKIIGQVRFPGNHRTGRRRRLVVPPPMTPPVPAGYLPDLTWEEAVLA